MLNLVFGCHLVFRGPFCFGIKILQRVIMNYHAKSGASSLKIDKVIKKRGGRVIFGKKKSKFIFKIFFFRIFGENFMLLA
jgi:hypothetical protein